MTEQEHAIAIARVSAGHQREEDQAPGLRKYADDKGYVLDAVVPVHGRSAFHGRHVKAILSAVDTYVRNGHATVVIFRHVDRSSREGVFEGMRLMNQIMDAGARIEFSEQEYLNDNPGLIGFFFEVAKGESQIKHDRREQGISQMRATGQIVGRAPWGYDPVYGEGLNTKATGIKVQVGIKPNALGRKWIPVIFDAAINGKSLRNIVRMLDGVPSPRANAVWDDDAARRIIRNTTYYGQMKNNPFLTFEPLIGIEVYKQANAALSGRLTGRSTTKREPALAKPFCGHCYGREREGAPSGRSPMYRVNRSKWSYYVCVGHGPRRSSCAASGIPLAELDTLIDETMAADDRPHMVRVPVAGDDNDERREVLKEKASAAMAANDFALSMKLAEEAMKIGPSLRKTRIEDRDTGTTIGQHWQTLSAVEKREELTNWLIIAGMNNGEVYAIIDRPGAHGQNSLNVVGKLPGPTLLERAKAKGIDKIVDAEASADDWQDA
jgi:DNA invertase Pin-like site-specific DNA recombinase